MSRTDIAARTIRRSDEGAVIRVDFRGRRPGAMALLARLPALLLNPTGVLVVLGVAWLITIIASMAFANGLEQSRGTAGVAARASEASSRPGIVPSTRPSPDPADMRRASRSAR